jgi:hypothetical protein
MMDPQEAPVAAPQSPWVNKDIQRRIAWRDGDIVISVPVKSGTTWMMNIVHQLRSGGDAEFLDVYVEVPWLELMPGPAARPEGLIAGFDRMGHGRRRAFKTHSAPDVLPYVAPGPGPDVRYVVVVRNPDEVVASLPPFARAHSDAWFDLWQLPRYGLFRDGDVEAVVAGGAGALVAALFGFVAAWWPLRHQPNVLLLHFADLKRDHEGSLRRVAGFLGFDVPAESWAPVLEYTSFSWMKAHEEKFEIRHATAVPMLDPGAMIRKGKAGASAEDGITEALSNTIAEIGRPVLSDERAFEWFYHGGDALGR